MYSSTVSPWFCFSSKTSLHTTSLTPSHQVLFGLEKGWRRDNLGNWCSFVAICPSCHQPMLKTSTRPHLFFNHRLLREGTSLPFLFDLSIFKNLLLEFNDTKPCAALTAIRGFVICNTDVNRMHGTVSLSLECRGI